MGDLNKLVVELVQEQKMPVQVKCKEFVMVVRDESTKNRQKKNKQSNDYKYFKILRSVHNNH